MKAIILAGGLGTRMNLTVPKFLVPIKEKPLANYMLDSLMKLEIKEIIFLTGYKSELIQEFLYREYPSLDSKIIQDPPEQKGSYICSLLNLENLIDDDILFIHGDLVCEEKLLKKLIQHREKNSALTHINPYSTGKDFKAKIEKGLIKKIGVDFKGNLVMPLYKFSKKSFLTWLKSIKEFVDQGKINCYAEEAIEPYADKIRLKPLFYDKELCMEIDDINDLKKAESLIK